MSDKENGSWWSKLTPEKKAYYAEWQRSFRRTEKGKLHVRKMNLKKYGITPEEYDALLEAQGGVCASCQQEETGRNQYGVLPLAVDHDHETDAVRGLLCMRCNRSLGLLGDDVQKIEGLLEYRRKFL